MGVGAGGRFRSCGCRSRRASTAGLRLILHVGVDGLLLALNVLYQLLERPEAGLDFVNGVVEGLDLAGDLIDLSGLRLLLGLHLLMQRVDGDGHSVDGVGALLDEVLHDAHALVVGLLEAGNGVLKLLDLGLQLHHIFADRKGGGGAEKGCGQHGC